MRALRQLFVAGCCSLALAACVTLKGSGAAEPATVILISLDGFRHDFLDRPNAVRLRELATRGVRAERLIPSFPSKTFPNHYSIVTGLYPEHHGIAANVMRDSVLGRFTIGDTPAVRDARWWLGEPIWVTAEKQGVRSATYFWPGSEAPIGGVRPHWYFRYDDTTARATRVRTVLNWLALPRGEAPRLITVYFADVDTDAHNYGPDSPQADSAIARVDSAVGAIMDGVAQQGASERVNIVVVSDHGMTEIGAARLIELDDYVSMDSLDVIDWTPMATIVPKPGREDYVVRALTGAPHLTVYRKADIPRRLHYNEGPRVTPVIALAEEGWTITSHASKHWMKPGQTYGAHGYDNALPTMGAVFVAAGPAFRRDVTVPAFENVHIYSILARVLGLRPAMTDGSLDSVKTLLR